MRLINRSSIRLIFTKAANRSPKAGSMNFQAWDWTFSETSRWKRALKSARSPSWSFLIAIRALIQFRGLPLTVQSTKLLEIMTICLKMSARWILTFTDLSNKSVENQLFLSWRCTLCDVSTYTRTPSSTSRSLSPSCSRFTKVTDEKLSTTTTFTRPMSSKCSTLCWLKAGSYSLPS